MGHNEAMVNQVVVRPAGATSAVHIDPVTTTSTTPLAGAQTLHFGSQDLIRVADFAREQNYKVARFLVADSYLSPLDESEERQVSDELIDILTTYGGRELEAAMDEEYAGLYVTGVEFVSLTSGLRIALRRRGYVDTSVVDEAERLLNSAWRELKLT